MASRLLQSYLTSVATAVLNRAVGLLLTVGCVPLLLSELGSQTYGMLIAMIAAGSLINLVTMGLNSEVSAKVAVSNDFAADAEVVRRAVFRTLRFVLPISLLLFIMLWPATVSAAGGRLLGTESLAIGLMVLSSNVALIVALPAEAFQVGRQRQWVPNCFRAAGSVVAVSLLFAFAAFASLNLLSAALALTIPVAIPLLCNGLMVYRRLGVFRRAPPGAPPGKQAVSLHQWPYALMTVQAYCFTSLSVVLVSLRAGASEAATFSVLYRIAIVAMSLVTLITAPLWPAIIRARRHGRDRSHLKAMALACAGLTVYAVALGGSFAVYGDQLLILWTGGSIQVHRKVTVAFGAVLFLHVWNHLWATVLLGLERPKFVGASLAVDTVLLVSIFLLVPIAPSSEKMVLAMLVALSAWSALAMPAEAARAVIVGRFART